MSIPVLEPLAWMVLALAALCVGIGKTALPGIVTFAVALCAAVIPARESTAVLLLTLLVGDLIAIRMYIRTVDWGILACLVPSVLCGVVVGAFFLFVATDSVLRISIGVTLLILTALTLVLMKRHSAKRLEEFFARKSVRSLYGALGGFTTMTANSGGPVMNLYFVASGFDVHRFLGTQAWFFFAVNVLKLPFSIGIGLVNTRVITIAVLLSPLVIGGAIIGRTIVRRIPQKIFNALIIGLTVVSASYLLVM